MTELALLVAAMLWAHLEIHRNAVIHWARTRTPADFVERWEQRPDLLLALLLDIREDRP